MLILTIPHICKFFYTGKIFGEENLHRNLHSKLPIFRVKSVKIYTGQKKFTRAPPVTNISYVMLVWMIDVVFHVDVVEI